MIAFGKNGSDVTMAAVRLARAVTGRSLILQHGFHGFHDWYLATHSAVRGIPDELRSLVHSFPFNDLDALRDLFDRFEGRVAAVVMEPAHSLLPEPGYLDAVKRLASECGALLVFDEMVTGFRLARGGAQELFGVVPDLACFGKALANGMPLSALVGKRALMQHLPSVGFGMTFRGETLSLAAASATLAVIEREPVAEHLAAVGETVRAAFERDAARNGVECRLIGPPQRMTIAFSQTPAAPGRSLLALFLQECLKNGIITNGNLLPSLAHDAAAVSRTSAAFASALETAARAARRGEVRLVESGGSPDGPRAFLASGFVELLEEVGDDLRVGGWMLLEDGAADAVEMVSRSGQTVRAVVLQRSDLAGSFEHLRRAEDAGYGAVLPARDFARADAWEFTIRAVRGGRTAFACKVTRGRGRPPIESFAGPYWLGDGVLYV
jgi:acetylornithine/succinyldiaminopimelate/putrescine aminotransferase